MWQVGRSETNFFMVLSTDKAVNLTRMRGSAQRSVELKGDFKRMLEIIMAEKEGV
ncbi:MAG: hypothetical protein HY716_18470 [Planctomycetes bacterium]|nr:hypothetical protein [Planctomycetota bacterium]